jgi:hypothetical protein
MSYNYSTPEGKDPELWRLAQARASFKSHITIYLVMVAVFWTIWFLTGAHTYGRGFPWPVWPTFGWGIGVLFHYIGAYRDPKNNPAENEYQKLVDQQKNYKN